VKPERRSPPACIFPPHNRRLGAARRGAYGFAAMTNSTSTVSAKPRQSLQSRLFWFFAGAGVSYLLISTPFKLLRTHYPALPIWAVSACSIGVSTGFFFVWNYFVNFRTDSRKRDAFARYLGAVVLMWILSSSVLTALKHFDAKMAFNLGRFPLDLDIIATQFFLAGLKFFLYHKWAFPLPKEGAETGVVNSEVRSKK
jgi:hypothetical protein